jgi:hypothetical protein
MLLIGLGLAVAALAPASAPAKTGGTDRPVKGTAVGIVTVTLPGLHVSVDASGVLSHLGRYTGHFEGDAQIVQAGIVGGGIFTLAAANGDQLTGTFTLAEPPFTGAAHPVDTTLTIGGGSGRFGDASGTIALPLVATPTSLGGGLLVEAAEGPMKGLISY